MPTHALMEPTLWLVVVGWAGIFAATLCRRLLAT